MHKIKNRKINTTRNWLFQMSNKISKTLYRLTRERKRVRERERK